MKRGLVRYLVAAAFLSVFTASRAEATPFLWQYTGVVTQYHEYFVSCAMSGACGIQDAVPLGTPLVLDLYLDPTVPMDPNCYGYFGTSAASMVLHVGGQSYTTTQAHTWVDAHGFGSSAGCGPFNTGLEVVATQWSGPPISPDATGSLSGFIPTGGASAGIEGGGGPGLPTSPPQSLRLHSPIFEFAAPGSDPNQPGPRYYQSFEGALTVVPEPSTYLLIFTGLAAGYLRSRRRISA